ncbi:hypothetical protein [Streptomyces sp. MMG1121]|nr:hypothetical protein [Streptomyces sp. MMG1121]
MLAGTTPVLVHDCDEIPGIGHRPKLLADHLASRRGKLTERDTS